MKKTLSALAAAAAIAGMFSTSAQALCVDVKTNLQVKQGNAAVSNNQNCDRNTFANRQINNDQNTAVSKQTGGGNRVLSTQTGGDSTLNTRQKGPQNRVVAKQAGTGNQKIDAVQTDRGRRR